MSRESEEAQNRTARDAEPPATRRLCAFCHHDFRGRGSERACPGCKENLKSRPGWLLGFCHAPPGEPPQRRYGSFPSGYYWPGMDIWDSECDEGDDEDERD